MEPGAGVGGRSGAWTMRDGASVGKNTWNHIRGPPESAATSAATYGGQRVSSREPPPVAVFRCIATNQAEVRVDVRLDTENRRHEAHR